jgi:hypothetical protein
MSIQVINSLVRNPKLAVNRLLRRTGFARYVNLVTEMVLSPYGIRYLNNSKVVGEFKSHQALFADAYLMYLTQCMKVSLPYVPEDKKMWIRKKMESKYHSMHHNDLDRNYPRILSTNLNFHRGIDACVLFELKDDQNLFDLSIFEDVEPVRKELSQAEINHRCEEMNPRYSTLGIERKLEIMTKVI